MDDADITLLAPVEAFDRAASQYAREKKMGASNRNERFYALSRHIADTCDGDFTNAVHGYRRSPTNSSMWEINLVVPGRQTRAKTENFLDRLNNKYGLNMFAQYSDLIEAKEPMSKTSKYVTCPECDANFKDSQLVNGKLPAHQWRNGHYMGSDFIAKTRRCEGSNNPPLKESMSKTSKLVQSLLSGNLVKGTRLFNEEMKARIADALELRKVQAGKNLIKDRPLKEGVTGTYTKKALIRDPNTPIGQPGKMHINCNCGNKVSMDGGPAQCSKCGQKYKADGWLTEGRSYVIHTDKIGKETKRGPFTLRTQMSSGAGTEWVVLKDGKEIGYIAKPKDTRNTKYPYAISKFLQPDDEGHTSTAIEWNSLAGYRGLIDGTQVISKIYGYADRSAVGQALVRAGAEATQPNSGPFVGYYGTFKGQPFGVAYPHGERYVEIVAPNNSTINPDEIRQAIDNLFDRAVTDGRKEHDTLHLGHTYLGIDMALRIIASGVKPTIAQQGEPKWQ